MRAVILNSGRNLPSKKMSYSSLDSLNADGNI